jgi:hypothetical protein
MYIFPLYIFIYINKGRGCERKHRESGSIFVIYKFIETSRCLPLSKSNETVITSPVQNNSPYDFSLLLLCQIALLARKAHP